MAYLGLNLVLQALNLPTKALNQPSRLQISLPSFKSVPTFLKFGLKTPDQGRCVSSLVTTKYIIGRRASTYEHWIPLDIT